MIKKLRKFIKEKRHPYYMNENRKYKNLNIGEYSYGKPKIYASSNLFSMGKFCSIADGVVIYAGAEHNYNWVSSYNFTAKFDCKDCVSSKGSVHIGNDVWIGDGALVLSGVTIEDGAVIGARAVVTKDVGAYSIVAGNPAKHIKYRFEEKYIPDLLEIKWWDWSIEKIKSNFDLILSDDISLFINKFKREKND